MTLSNLQKTCASVFAMASVVALSIALQSPVKTEQEQCENLVRTNNLEIGKILSEETREILRRRSLMSLSIKATKDGGYTVKKCESENGEAKFTREEHPGPKPGF